MEYEEIDDTGSSPEYWGEEEPQPEEIKREEDLQILGSKLHDLAQEQVQNRDMIETRWLADLRQYQGEYTPEELSRMEGRSSVYVNITRNKTRAAISRLGDMLLPNDDRNYGIKPTPIPQGSVVDQQEQEAMKEKAREAARAMEEQIADDFEEALYYAHARDVIEDACIYGTGILKGPTIVNRTRQAWITDPATGQSVMEVQEEYRPSVERVDPWDFFPDMSAANMHEAEFCFERKLINKKQLRELASLPGVMLDQLRKAMQTEGSTTQIANDRRDELREISGVDTVSNSTKYELWEYWGPLDKDELRACGCEVDDDPLVEYTGCVLMVGNYVVKAAMNPLDSGDIPYSVFNWEQDGVSIFGFGVPYLMRQPQKVTNAAWRMMMDNAAVSAGPQVVVNKRAVEPQDGDWTIRRMKTWLASGDIPVNQAFGVYGIQSNQGDLSAIFQMSQQLADTETNLPILLQGEGVSGGPGSQTATGMKMLMNNSNIVLRSAVKNFDDGVTVPTVRRFYDFHMAYTDRPEIKGDFDVIAKGTSVLIAREEQQEKLMMLAQLAGSNPEFARMTDWQELYKEILRTMQVGADNVTIDEQKIEEAPEQQPDLATQMAMQELQLKQAELQLKQQEAELKAVEDAQQIDLKRQQQQWEQQYKAAELQTKQERDRLELALKEGITLAQLEQKAGLESARLETEMQRTAAQLEIEREKASAEIQTERAKLQTERDKLAAQLADKQAERAARNRNQNMGYDSY
ncbi:portal protein [Spiribacter onubensis]|uniref:Cell envelope integrity protein TolA n=1 Tax=Spiribacter onubensis TaxID=3122420 RepID=A0ABV3S9Y5_9GAMM